jgi:hypothetical protein
LAEVYKSAVLSAAEAASRIIGAPWIDDCSGTLIGTARHRDHDRDDEPNQIVRHKPNLRIVQPQLPLKMQRQHAEKVAPWADDPADNAVLSPPFIRLPERSGPRRFGDLS